MIDITLNYFTHVFNRMGKITITSEFISYRNDLTDKFNDYGRTKEEKIRCADGLLPEFLILKNEMADAPKNIKSDFYLNHMYIDNKMINEDANTVTIPNRKTQWMKDAVISKDLTHFMVTKWKTRPEECKGDNGRALQEGDVVEFEIITILPAREAIKSLTDSIWYADSKYFWAK